MEHLGPRLKLARLSLGLTQQTLAERADTATTVISVMETGRARGESSKPYEPGIELMKRIADVLGMPIDAFFHPLTDEEHSRLADLERQRKEGRRIAPAAE